MAGGIENPGGRAVMNFQQLRHFVAVAHFQNLRKAAEQLHISHAGLSRSINALEDLVGLRLFERRPRGVALTPLGEQFLPWAKSLLNEHGRAMSQLRAHRDLGAGQVILGINHMFSHDLAPDAVATLLSRFGNLEVRIVSDDYRTLVRKLLESDIDFALSLYIADDPHPGLVYEDLFKFETRICARPGHPLAQGGPITPEDLAEAKWALIEGMAMREAFASYFRGLALPTPRVALHAASIAFLVHVVTRVDLLTVLPVQIARSDWVREQLVVLGSDSPFGVARCGLLHRADRVRTPAAIELADTLRRHASYFGVDG
jgi:DNA-binding transcriptional LysR family regulator